MLKELEGDYTERISRLSLVTFARGNVYTNLRMFRRLALYLVASCLNSAPRRYQGVGALLMEFRILNSTGSTMPLCFRHIGGVLKHHVGGAVVAREALAHDVPA